MVSFPFNVCNNPMYDGSTMCFLATALYKESPTGLLLSILVFAEYRIALLFEEPFTAKIVREGVYIRQTGQADHFISSTVCCSRSLASAKRCRKTELKQ